MHRVCVSPPKLLATFSLFLVWPPSKKPIIWLYLVLSSVLCLPWCSTVAFARGSRGSLSMWPKHGQAALSHGQSSLLLLAAQEPRATLFLAEVLW